jgi:hypothetical protein
MIGLHFRRDRLDLRDNRIGRIDLRHVAAIRQHDQPGLRYGSGKWPRMNIG